MFYDRKIKEQNIVLKTISNVSSVVIEYNCFLDKKFKGNIRDIIMLCTKWCIIEVGDFTGLDLPTPQKQIK